MEYRERRRILFLGLPWTFTVYTVNEEMINMKRGLLKTLEDDCYMYKVTDVQLETSFLERLCGVGTVICYTGDNTSPTLKLIHIKKAGEIKNFILKVSEEARMKRRTLNTLNLNGGGHLDDVDIDD